MKNRRAIYILIMGLCFIFLMSGCGKSDSAQNEDAKENDVQENNTNENNTNADDTNKNDKNEDDATNVTSEDGQPIVTITMGNGESISLELYPDIAPNTVNNFISLIQDDFYDGLLFHRVIPEFMIQGGDPEGNGSGGPGYAIKGEFSSNGFENDLEHERGVLSMARSGDPDSAGSQFFIVVADSPHLDGDYAGFGRVIDGMDTVEDIVSVETGANDKPTSDQIMETVEVDLNGYDDFSEPEKM